MNWHLTTNIERFPLSAPFAISRGVKTQADVVVVSISNGAFTGRGECVPYARYGESTASVCAAIESVRDIVEAELSREALQRLLPPGAARNAIDCALWDLDAKRLGIRARDLAGLHRTPPVTTAYTISVGAPDVMALAAAAARHRPILKVKLSGDGDAERLAAVRQAAPAAELIADANESWREDQLESLFAACVEAGVALIEQPLPAGRDDALAQIARPVPVCADESVHDRAGLAALRNRYDAINIKLDKTGGLTEALALVRAAQQEDFAIMIGSMVGTSLGAAPALLLAPFAQWIDLDGPLLLQRDRENGLRFEGSVIYPPEAALWG